MHPYGFRNIKTTVRAGQEPSFLSQKLHWRRSIFAQDFVCLTNASFRNLVDKITSLTDSHVVETDDINSPADHERMDTRQTLSA